VKFVFQGAIILVQLGSVAAHLNDTGIFINLVKKMRNSVNHEVVNTPKVTAVVSLMSYFLNDFF